MTKKILAVASSGGHWQQLKLLIPAFSDQKLYFITTTNNLVTKRNIPINSSFSLFKVVHANRRNKIKVVIMAVQIFIYLLIIRPDVVISTGAAPGYFAILFGKILKAKTVWVDSMANYGRLSLSGEKSKKYCDLVLVQWPKLKHLGDYWGRLL